MCYDIKTSLFALIINIITSITLFMSTKNKQLKTISLFFLFVGFMQFWDIIFWKYDASTLININSTKIAMIWNHLEPIILALLICYYINPLTISSKIIVGIYTVSVIIYSINAWNKLKGTEVTKDTCGSLYWQWNNMKGSMFVYTIFLLCLIILSLQFDDWIKLLSISIIVITFFFSFYKYRINSSSGRFWCYFSAFSPILFLIYISFNHFSGHA
jgi:hypothetical protein